MTPNKNRYNRKKLSGGQINDLIKLYHTKDKYESIFSEKKFENEYSWRNDVVRNLDVDSCNKFFYLLEKNIPSCKNCKQKLTIDDYSYGSKELKFKGFKLYCSKCSKLRPWLSMRDTTEIGKSISQSMKKWFRSPAGKKQSINRGKRNSVLLKKFFKTERGKQQIVRVAKLQSAIIKEKIKNGIFTPSITNSWTHWTSQINLNGKKYKFRSSWEACFFLCNPHLKYEKIRIPYKLNQYEKIYIGDFFDAENRILYEIKPRSTYNSQSIKINAAIEYCLRHNIKFIWVNEGNILNYIDGNKINGQNRKQYDKMISGIKYD